ncbi:MAG: hypothetical protein U9P12_02210 [Verrucomicrobiota bacterium]|nr:hypothetical protein [Verrucomicrobiota bacterium]
MKKRGILSMLFCVAIGHAEEYAFERYRLIIDKQPFGKEALDPQQFNAG